jgi:hypothetical protein
MVPEPRPKGENSAATNVPCEPQLYLLSTTRRQDSVPGQCSLLPSVKSWGWSRKANIVLDGVRRFVTDSKMKLKQNTHSQKLARYGERS